jgi:hypothetical protein
MFRGDDVILGNFPMSVKALPPLEALNLKNNLATGMADSLQNVRTASGAGSS